MAEVQVLVREHRGDSRAALIVIAAAFLCVGGILFPIGSRSLLEAWRYRDAVRTDAIATGKALRLATDTSATAYELSYRAVLEGRVHERTDAVPVHLWERVEPSSVVQVEHQRGRPESVRIVPDTSNQNDRSKVLMAIGALLILVGFTAGARALRRRPSSHPDEQRPLVASTKFPASYWPLARRSSEFRVGAIFLTVSLSLVVVTMAQISEEWRLARNGVSTDGMILTKELKRSGRGNPKSYEATYRFMVPEGTFESRAPLSYDSWARVKERQAAEVLYLPDRPSTSRLAGPRPWGWAAFMAVLGCALFAIGAAFVVRSIRQARELAGRSQTS